MDPFIVITNLKENEMKKSLIKSVKILVAALILGAMVVASSGTYASVSDPPSGGSPAPMPRPPLPTK
jgi:hypothetical protein